MCLPCSLIFPDWCSGYAEPGTSRVREAQFLPQVAISFTLVSEPVISECSSILVCPKFGFSCKK